MKIKCTLTFAKTMQKEFDKNEKTKDYKIELLKLTDEQYSYWVDFDGKSMDFDYNWGTGIWQVLKIIYPQEYYAIPQYLTTRDLHKIYKDSDKTYSGFVNALIDYIEI